MEIKQENASKLKYLLYDTLRSAPNVSFVEWVNPGAYGFSNMLEFIVKNKNYRIDWSWNFSKLYFEKDAMFIFNKVKVEGTWPNGYKNNLQFYYYDDPVAVIPLEEY